MEAAVSGPPSTAHSVLALALLGLLKIISRALDVVLLLIPRSVPADDPKKPVPADDPKEFERHVRAVHARGKHSRAPCILDSCAANCTHFAIGTFDLVCNDIDGVMDAKMATAVLDSLSTSGIARAYELRRELVHFKKACLLLLRDVLRLERGLVRQSSFFYTERRRCGSEEGHRCAACCEWRAARRRELAFGRRAWASAAVATAVGSTDDYLEVCEALQGVKGLRLALSDMRNLTKLVCLLPRHPDDAAAKTPHELRDVRAALSCTAAVERALAEAATAAAAAGGGGRAACAAAEAEEDDTDGSRRERERDSAPICLRAEVMEHALVRHLEALPPSLPAPALTFVRQSLLARGAAKAVAQAEGARLVARAFRDNLRDADEALASLRGREAEAEARAMAVAQAEANANAKVEVGTEAEPEVEAEDLAEEPWLAEADRALVEALRREMRAGRHLRLVSMVREASSHLLDTLELLLAGGGDGGGGSGGGTSGGGPGRDPDAVVGTTHFVASDSMRGEHAAWVPPPFAALKQLVARWAEVHGRFEARMRGAMAAEGWPPPSTAGRARVHEGGPLQCRRCLATFSRLWQERGVCWTCEERVRRAGLCPFDRGAVVGATDDSGCTDNTSCAVGIAVGTAAAAAGSSRRAAPPHPFCAHQARCAACDEASFVSCAACRLAQGDGDAVLAACDAWRPRKLFLDFDRTLCSTRGGADPTRGGQHGNKGRGAAHAIDAELHTAASLPYVAETHVVTRNRHTAEIRAFLAERGVDVASVHSTPSGESKAAFMLATLGEGERGLFVDDSAGEICDPRIAGDVRIFRVLFAR